MKYVFQFLRIMVFAFIGELLNYLIPLPIPASIYGIVLLFLALELKIVKVSDIKETSSFLIAIM
ncbi:MAG: CidA/LrgA family protein, partial [Candidatus Cryptobacteroides sp.]